MKKYSDRYISKIDWEDVQKFYDNEKTWKDLIDKFKFNNTIINYARKVGLIKMRSRSESNKIYNKKSPRILTQETKDKISKARKEYLKNNPDKVPYLLNHSKNESYPEKYFTELFEKEGIKLDKKVRVGLYELDFSVPTKKIDIEIDGSQHYLDEKIVKSDIRRTKFLEENGWDVIRINWSSYQKLNFNEKSQYIFNIKNYINSLSNNKPTIKIINKKICICGSIKYKNAKTCNKCRGDK